MTKEQGSSDTPQKYCLGCYYPVDRITSKQCPECGRAFDPDDVSTYALKPRRSLPIYGFVSLISAAMVWLFILGIPLVSGLRFHSGLTSFLPTIISLPIAMMLGWRAFRHPESINRMPGLIGLLVTVPLFLIITWYLMDFREIWAYWTYWHWRMP